MVSRTLMILVPCIIDVPRLYRCADHVSNIVTFPKATMRERGRSSRGHGTGPMSANETSFNQYLTMPASLAERLCVMVCPSVTRNAGSCKKLTHGIIHLHVACSTIYYYYYCTELEYQQCLLILQWLESTHLTVQGPEALW